MTTTTERGLLFSTDLLIAVVIVFLASLVALAFLANLVSETANTLPAYRLQREGLFFLDALVKNDEGAAFQGLAVYSPEFRRVLANRLRLPSSLDLRAYPFVKSLRLVDEAGHETVWADLRIGPLANRTAQGNCYAFTRFVLLESETKALLNGVFCNG